MNWTYFIIVTYAYFLYHVKSADFICTEGEVCRVFCNGTSAGESRSACDSVICPSDASCTVECFVDYACEYADIICPSDANCDIKCIGVSACREATLNWNNPLAGTGSLTCDGEYACSGFYSGFQFPTPLKDEALEVICNGTAECNFATIVCPTNASCDIKCIGDSACGGATLNWNNPIAGTGSLTCDGSSACSGVQFPTPLKDENLNVTCDNNYECFGATIVCPTNASCDIKCIGELACRDATLNWNNPIAGTGSLTCDGEYACYGVEFPTPVKDENLNVTCNHTQECAYATIVCPTDAECRVICGVEDSCLGTTIESCGQLVVTCAAGACTNKVQTCPTSQPTGQPTQPTSAPTHPTGQPTHPTSAPTTTSAPTEENSPDANDSIFVYFCSCIVFLIMLFV